MRSKDTKSTPEVSVVIPVYNEQAVLAILFERIYPVLDAIPQSYELIFVDDGSRDRSVAELRTQYQKRSDVTRVVLLHANVGQHAALLAGFEHTRGKYIITLDADLQNPPEELPKLLSEMEKGYDYVGTIRRKRQDRLWRHWASRIINRLRERITNIKMTDQGCMFRAYHRDIIKAILDSSETHAYLPGLGYLYARNPIEITIEHEARAAGESKYSLLSLIQLNFDLITAFSIAPLQFFSLVGMSVSLFSFIFVIYMALRRLVIGPEVQGVFTLFGIVFFMIGVLLFGIGLLGEYVGRIYVQVRQRPQFSVLSVLEKSADEVTESDK